MSASSNAFVTFGQNGGDRWAQKAFSTGVFPNYVNPTNAAFLFPSFYDATWGTGNNWYGTATDNGSLEKFLPEAQMTANKVLQSYVGPDSGGAIMLGTLQENAKSNSGIEVFPIEEYAEASTQPDNYLLAAAKAVRQNAARAAASTPSILKLASVVKTQSGFAAFFQKLFA